MVESVDLLSPLTGGRWFVRTQGSEHTFDLDNERYMRHQLDGLNPMRRDREWLALPKKNVLRWPRVGQTFIILVPEVVNEPLTTTVRRSSIIVSIVRSVESPQPPSATD